MALTPKPPPGYLAAQSEFLTRAGGPIILPHLEPLHVWMFRSQPDLSGEGDRYVCTGCPIVARIGDSIPLPCAGRAAQ